MSYADFRRRQSEAIHPGFASAADASANDRADFMRLTYLHLGGAILAFAGLTALLVNSSFAPSMMAALAGSRFMWLIVLGAFMLVGAIAQRWATSGASVGMQYTGLGLYILAEAIIFVPLVFIANLKAPGSVGTAAVLTATVFGGLTVTALVTKRDFSFLGRALTIAGFAAMGMIIVSILFGFTLGSFFSLAMVVVAAGYILYQSSQIMYHYPVGSHVAASLALFASVALLFWYILRLVMAARD
ncbi:MAG: Bax inhibitor-1 family protein [bacterium]